RSKARSRMGPSSSPSTIQSDRLPVVPGEYFLQDGEVELNPGRPTARVRVENAGDRPIQVGSHTHFFEVNTALRFDRDAAYGCRLDVQAGTSLRVEPGEARDVILVALGGPRFA